MHKILLYCISSILLLACGDSSDTKKPEVCFNTSIYNCPSSAFNDPFGISLIFAWYSGQCTEEVACTEEESSNDFPSGIITGDYIDALSGITQTTEQEPNNTFDDSLAFFMQQGATVAIRGSIDSATDLTDFVVFGSLSNDLHAVYVCREPGVCTLPFYQQENIYIELYDENRVLIGSTLNNLSPNGQSLSFTPTLGRAYYVSINAIETQGMPLNYELVVTD